MNVLSVSLGSKSRDKTITTNIGDIDFTIERRGVDGCFRKFYQTIKDVDGQVDIITTGALHHYLVTLTRTFPFNAAKKIAGFNLKTPVIDGHLYREWAEPYLIKKLVIDKTIVPQQQVLFPLATNRLTMVKALTDAGLNVTLGDLIYDINLFFPMPIKSIKIFNFFSNILGPIVTKIPYAWLYPTGRKQDEIVEKYPHYFAKADIIAGDFHNIRRFMPKTLANKIIITNTVTKNDRFLLKERNLAKLITLSPTFDDRTFGSNVINGILYLILKERNLALTKENYIKLLQELQFEPVIEKLSLDRR